MGLEDQEEQLGLEDHALALCCDKLVAVCFQRDIIESNDISIYIFSSVDVVPRFKCHWPLLLVA